MPAEEVKIFIINNHVNKYVKYIYPLHSTPGKQHPVDNFETMIPCTIKANGQFDIN